jgi:hypothetical protein
MRRSGRRLDGLRGIADAPVEAVPVEDLEAIVSHHADRVPEPTEEALVRHDAVCSALMADGPVAPIRFGAVYSDTASLRSEIAARRNDLRAILARLEGHVEIGVRVLRATPSNEGAATTGSDYLRRRLEDRRVALRAASAVDERLGAVAAARRARKLETQELLLSVSYLVAQADVERFLETVEAVASGRPDLSLVCTGPWAPYSFVDADE